MKKNWHDPKLIFTSMLVQDKIHSKIDCTFCKKGLKCKSHINTLEDEDQSKPLIVYGLKETKKHGVFKGFSFTKNDMNSPLEEDHSEYHQEDLLSYLKDTTSNPKPIRFKSAPKQRQITKLVSCPLQQFIKVGCKTLSKIIYYIRGGGAI